MQIKITDKDGVILKTGKKYCEEDISVTAKTEELNITPSAEEQVKEGLFDKVTVVGDRNLVPENIIKGKTIFNVEGDFTPLDTSDATATEEDILLGKTAYVNGEKINGTLEAVDTRDADATDNDLLLGKTAYVNNRKITGTLNITDNNAYIDISKRLDSWNSSYEQTTFNRILVKAPDKMDVGHLTKLRSLFYYCTALIELTTKWENTNNITSLESCFHYCSSLKKVDLSSFDMSNITTLYGTFYQCTSLEDLKFKSLNISNVSMMNNTFMYCKSLMDLDLSYFDFSKIIGIDNTFYSCTNLTNLKFGINLGKGYTQKTSNYVAYKLNLSYSPLLTHESLMNVINNLYDLNLTYDVANGGTLYTQGLVLGSTNKAKLTEEEIAIATSKGWNVS